MYTSEVSFHDLNLLHDHADLAGPLRIRVDCNPLRFVTRYRELKSKLEQFNLLGEVSVDHDQPRGSGKQTVPPLILSHCSSKPTDDLTEQPDADDVPEYPAQDGEGDENPISEVFDQTTTEQQTDGVGSGVQAVDHFDEGESPNETEPEQAQPAGDEESTAGPLSADEHAEQPVGVVEDDHEQGTAVTTDSDSGYPGSAEVPVPSTFHEHIYLRNAPLGGNSTEYEEVVTTNEDYEADYNGDDPEGELGETVTIEGDARYGGREATVPDPQTQGGQEQYETQRDTVVTNKCKQVIRTTAADGLTPHAQILTP